MDPSTHRVSSSRGSGSTKVFLNVVSRQNAGYAAVLDPVVLHWLSLFLLCVLTSCFFYCQFAMKNASMCSDGWVFDPRRVIVEAAKVRGVLRNSVGMPG